MTADARRRAPYITAYSEEVVSYQLALAPALEATDGLRLAYADPVDSDWMFGVLWHRHGMTRAGLPEWKLVNTARQRRCMLRLLCQVCGQPATEPDGRTWWVLPEPPAKTGVGDPFTNAPPTCHSCVPAALRLCPRLRESAHVYSATAADPYGVVADVFKPLRQGIIMVSSTTEVPLEAYRDLEYALAKQLIVTLEGLHEVHARVDSSLPVVLGHASPA